MYCDPQKGLLFKFYFFIIKSKEFIFINFDNNKDSI